MAILDVLKSGFRPFFDKIGMGLIIFILGLIVGRLMGRLAQKILREIEINRIIRKVTGLSFRIDSIIASIVRYAILFIFGIWALDAIGLGDIVFNIVAGVIIVIIILSIVLGIKDFVPNAMAGLFIHLKNIIRKDEKIMCQGVEGTVLDVDLVETKIKTDKGDILFIPNSIFIKNPVKKFK